LEETQPIETDDGPVWPLISWANFREDLNSEKRIHFSQDDVDHMRALYDGEIAQADHYLRAFFDAFDELGLEDNTVVVFLAEHGELLGENGIFMKASATSQGSLTDQLIHIPLIIKHPKVDYLLRVDKLVQIVDVLPSILSILEIDDPQKKDRQGRNILPAIMQNHTVNDYVFAGMKRKYDPRFLFQPKNVFYLESIRNKKWKLIKRTMFERDTTKLIEEAFFLYDIQQDPGETTNMYQQEEQVVRELNAVLMQWAEDAKE
jgi:arylsulfatase A-like enzyme